MRPSENKSIFAQACCRVDLAGGTLDLWPLYLFHEGAVTVNMGISIWTRCRITPSQKKAIRLKSLDTGKEDCFADADALLQAKKFRHPLAGFVCRFFLRNNNNDRQGRSLFNKGFLLETHSESPAGAGISGSSALMIATTAAFSEFVGRKMPKDQVRVIAQNIEAQLIRVPTGCQDYYPALYGGVSAIHLSEDGIHCEKIDVPLAEVSSRFVLVYTGAPRQSGINNWEVFKAHIDGNQHVHKNFSKISAIAQGMRAALLIKDWSEVSRLLREEWKLRKTNAPGITTPRIESLVTSAMKQGARAAKVCGAGGGGCVVFFVEPDAHQRVSQAISADGGQVLPFKVTPSGLSVRSQ